MRVFECQETLPPDFCLQSLFGAGQFQTPKLRPGDSPSYLYADTASAAGAFIGLIRLAERKAAQNGAPAYFFVFQLAPAIASTELHPCTRAVF